MSCPNEQAWLIAELGDVTVNEREALVKHAHSCPVCTVARERQQRLLADLTALPRLGGSAEAFLAGVVARTREAGAVAPAAARSRSTRVLWPTLAMLSVAAALALVCLPSRDDGVADRIQARGGKADKLAERAASADVFVARGKTLASLRDATLHEGDRLAVRILNPSAEPSFLMAFAIDARGDVHWLYPAYSDAASNPESLALGETDAPLVLRETVELDHPAPGMLRVVSLVSRKRMSVLEVEKRLADRPGKPLASMFPESSLREWKCTWSAR